MWLFSLLAECVRSNCLVRVLESTQPGRHMSIYGVSVSVSVLACVCLHSLTTTLSSVSFKFFMTLLLLCPSFLNPGREMKEGNYQNGNPYNQLLSLSLTISWMKFASLFSSVQSLSCIRLVAIPWTEKPGKLQSMGSQRVRHDLPTKQQQIGLK